MFTKNKNIKVKRKVDGKINLYFRCNVVLKSLQLLKRRTKWFIKRFNLISKQCYLIV